MRDVSVVIVNYNVKELVLSCLHSVYAGIGGMQEPEVIVVDNHSSDGSVEAVAKAFPQVLIIANEFNAGFSGGNNQGMTLANGRYVLLLNPDTEILGDALLKMRTYMEHNPGCAMIAPQLLNSDGSIQTSVWKEHHPVDLILETLFLHKLFGRLYYPPEKLHTTFEPGSMSGAALFFRKELIRKTGMMDEELFWMEDVDLCKRAAETGTLVYLHTAQVIHHSGQSQKKNYNIAISNQLLSKLKYYRKNSSFAAYAMAVLFCFFFILSRLIAFTLLMPFSPLYPLKAKAYAFTFRRFFRYLFLHDKSIS